MLQAKPSSRVIFTGIVFVCASSLLSYFSYLFYSPLMQSRSELTDARLQKAVNIFNLKPLQIRRYEADPKFILGQALFFDPVLSGNRDVSCATCHLLKHGSSDGLARSIGTYGEGLGPDRVVKTRTQIHPRNSLDLWNRDNNAVKSLFWDGHVEVWDSKKRLFRSPLGDALPKGFQNAMAVQSVFPITIPDEMLGGFGDHSKSSLPEAHRNKRNDLLISKSFLSEKARIQSVHWQLLKRLLGINDEPESWQKEYRNLFYQAYPNKNYTEVSIVDLGNAIAHFEELAFAANDSAWDKYLYGDRNAISESAKEGALVFYGKGRCAACHRSELFSDFSYHNVGIYSKINIEGNQVDDLGRWFATKLAKDRYKFRTSPLRNVTKSAPYFHDGSTANLEEAISRHLDPLAKAGSYSPDGSFAMEKEQIDSISPILVTKINLTSSEIKSLINFLSSLESQSRATNQIVPKSVPSGLAIEYR